MTAIEFENRCVALRGFSFREDFETALYELYIVATPAQQVAIREQTRSGALQSPQTWRNPTDYERSDLTREMKLRQSLVAMSIRNGSDDSRDDLLSIAYCYHNLAVMGVDADSVLEDPAQMSSPEFGKLVLGFARRIPEE